MQDHLLSAIPIGFVLSFMIGPVFFVLLETAATKGFRAALVFDLGVVLADAAFIYIAYFASYSLLQKIENQPYLFLLGGGILVTYGIISLVKTNIFQRKINLDTQLIHFKNNYLALFVKGFGLNFINIGVLGFWLGLIVVFVPKWQLTAQQTVLFFGTIIGAYLATDIVKIILAKQLKSKLTTHRIFQIKKGIAILLIFFGMLLMAQAFFPENSHKLEKVIERIE
jgi:threonine/homoserine/homoserine lactone efflux protein